MSPIIELGMQIENFLNQYGLESKREINSFDLFYGLNRKDDLNIKTIGGRCEILHCFFNGFSGGLYIKDFFKYYYSPLPAELEENFKSMMQLVIMTARKHNENYNLSLGLAKEGSENFVEEYDEVLNFISKEWGLHKHFSTDSELEKIGSHILFDIFRKRTGHLKFMIETELPLILYKNSRTKELFDTLNKIQ